MYESFRLVELVIVMVFGNVEDEKTLSTLIFMKSKLRNWLTTHLDLVVRMYTQDFFTLQSFPFYMAIIEWNEEKSTTSWSYNLCMWYGILWFVDSIYRLGFWYLCVLFCRFAFHWYGKIHLWIRVWFPWKAKKVVGFCSNNNNMKLSSNNNMKP